MVALVLAMHALERCPVYYVASTGRYSTFAQVASHDEMELPPPRSKELGLNHAWSFR